LPCACFKPLARSKIIEAASSTPIGLGTSYERLCSEVVDRKLCTFCGACVSACLLEEEVLGRKRRMFAVIEAKGLVETL